MLFDGKVNIVSVLRRSKFKIPSNYQQRQEKPKKKKFKENREFLHKIGFC